MKTPERILIYRLGSLGDTVVALPCLHLIRTTFPTARITVLTNAPVSEKAAPLETVLQHSGLIDAILHYPIGLRDPAKLAQLRSKIRSGDFDLVISLTAARGFFASVRDYLFFRSCGIRRIVGIPFRHRDLFCQPILNERAFEAESKRLLRRIRSIGTIASDDPAGMDLGLTPAELTEAKDLLDRAGIQAPFIVVSIGSKSPLKDWGDENWRRFLAELGHERPELAMVMLGSADEVNRHQSLLDSWPGPKANFCGNASPRVSAAILQRARLFIGHDSGPMHLAAAVGTRCAIVYSAQARPGQWFPGGSGHKNLYPYPFFDASKVSDADHQRKAIASIRVEDVLAATRDCLS